MRNHSVSIRQYVVCGGLALGLAVAVATPVLALAQDDPPACGDSSFSIADNSVRTFFDQHDGTSTFGAPISREFVLMGTTVQLFENAAVEIPSDGSVQVLEMTSTGLVPFARLNGLTVPAPDPAMAFVAPTRDQANYPARLRVFLQSSVSDTWNGAPVAFASTLVASGGPEVWGAPTSAPKADPNNPNFIYQRFQNGIFMYGGTAGTTQPMPMGAYLKALLTGQNLPADLDSEAPASPLLRQYDPTRQQSVAMPGTLPNSDLTDAFAPDLGTGGC